MKFDLPDFMRDNLRIGLKWHEDGHSGDGLKPETVAQARQGADDGEWSAAKWAEADAWASRHDASFPDGKDDWTVDNPTPAMTSWALWALGREDVNEPNGPARKALREKNERMKELDKDGARAAAVTVSVGDSVSRVRPSAVDGIHPRLATRAFNVPLMLRGVTFDALIQSRMGGFEIEVEPEDEGRHETISLPHGVVIPVLETLVHRGVSDPCMSMTCYDEIRHAIESARVRGASFAILDIDSGGGEVGGAFELADYLYALRDTFPVYGIANSFAFSAAYLILSACKAAYVTPVGGVGSIGVIARWRGQAKQDAAEGVQYIEVVSRRLKNALSPHRESPLPEGLASLQDMVDRADRLFVAAVALHRGLDPAAIEQMEAGERFGEAAVEAGLVDAVMTMPQLIDDLRAEYSASTRKTNSGANMKTTTVELDAQSNAPVATADTHIPAPAETVTAPAVAPLSNEAKPAPFKKGDCVMVGGQMMEVVDDGYMGWSYMAQSPDGGMKRCADMEMEPLKPEMMAAMESDRRVAALEAELARVRAEAQEAAVKAQAEAAAQIARARVEAQEADRRARAEADQAALVAALLDAKALHGSALASAENLGGHLAILANIPGTAAEKVAALRFQYPGMFAQVVTPITQQSLMEAPPPRTDAGPQGGRNVMAYGGARRRY